MRNRTIAMLLPTLLAGALSTGAAAAQPPQPGAVAQECTACHQSAPNTLMGRFDNVAFKAKTIQMRIDDRVELVKFDEDDVKVLTAQGKTIDGDALHQTKPGQALKIEYNEESGVKTAIRIVEKPVVKVAADQLISTADLQALLQQAKGSYFLFDTRPAAGFQRGAIPGAASLPYPLTAGLPANKNALLVFYCDGASCSLAPATAAKAKELGYTRVKVYRDGVSGWSAMNYTALPPQALKDAWLGQGNPCVLLDLRPAKEAAKGHLPGAVSFPANRIAKLIDSLPDADRRPPLVLYDAKGGKDAEKAARALIKAGYRDVKLLTGGFAGWKGSKYRTVSGKLAAKATYAPKPRQGEIDVARFEKYAAALPADVIIIDVRNPDEVKGGMVKGAKNIPTEEIRARMAELPKDKTIVTQCTTGVRAEMAYHALKQLGYGKVAFLNANVAFAKDGSYTITAK